MVSQTVERVLLPSRDWNETELSWHEFGSSKASWGVCHKDICMFLLQEVLGQLGGRSEAQPENSYETSTMTHLACYVLSLL